MDNLIKRLTFGNEYENSFVKLPYLVLFISIIVSLGFTFLFYRSTQSKDSIRFQGSTEQIQTTLEYKLNSYISLLKLGRAFIETSDSLDRKKFNNYISSLGLEENYPGLVAVGFSKVVPKNEIPLLINQMKDEGVQNFKVFPETDEKFQYPIIYIEPLNEKNKKAHGYDMFTEPTRRQALERARDFSTEAATGKVVLIQETDEQKKAGFLIYSPVYKDGKNPSTIQDRRDNLIGYIYIPFRAIDFINASVGENLLDGIEFKIYDNDVGEGNLLASSENTTNQNLADENVNKGFYTKKTLNVAGRRWIIEYAPTKQFFDQSNTGLISIVLIAGFAFSFLLFALTYAQSYSRRKLQKIAEDLLEVEQEKQVLFEKEQRARMTAEQANKIKDEFISVVSHELRTPLNAIAGWAKILKTDNLTENTKELALQKIEKNLRSQTNLVEEILEYSQIISGKIELENEKFAFSDVFENVFDELEPIAEKKEVKLTKNNNLNEQVITGDRRKIKIVLENLISNAIKFTPSGGKIETEAFAENGDIYFRVKDDGAGINSDFLPFIFDRFRQEDGSLTKFHGGLGLGLAISEHIIKLHKGSIEAASEGHEKGSVFTVKIPCKTD